jgi:N-succinyl-L-ornithine transcarbamylase
MEAIVFNVDKEGWALEFEEGAIMSGNTVEHIKDAGPILGQYFDILCIRTFPSLKNREDDYSEMFINQFIKYAGVPVVSLESATLTSAAIFNGYRYNKRKLQQLPFRSWA